MAEKIIYYVLPTYTQTPSLNTNFTCDNVNYKGFLFSDSTSETGDLLLVYNHGWLDNKYKYINISNKTSWFIENNCSKPITCFIFRKTKNCTIDNSQTIIDSGESYTSTVTLAEGKTWEQLKSISVLMGGVDITSTAWDSVNHVINISSVTGNLDMNINIGDVPAAYTEYDWIQSSGSQYIDTGVVGKTGIGADIKFKYNQIVNDSTVLGNRRSPYFEFHYNTRFYLAYAGNFNYNTSISASANTLYEASIRTSTSSQTLKVNSTLVYSGINTNTYNTNINMWLFASTSSGGSGSIVCASKVSVYSCLIYDGDSLVRDFRPVVRDSDSKPGLYDIVTETFYTNSGSGEFTYGND